eukprot:TRINITY_DN7974_c0_g1_i1.p2 TRINITY_DN7974_c0_g1~~TRINITY_DN7974_c0_g1_i1.p2  ORF type:complete len:107 (-),score=5.92 TRINITY_DN7974_c0_g1_i1:423-743(-)
MPSICYTINPLARRTNSKSRSAKASGQIATCKLMHSCSYKSKRPTIIRLIPTLQLCNVILYFDFPVQEPESNSSQQDSTIPRASQASSHTNLQPPKYNLQPPNSSA